MNREITTALDDLSCQLQAASAKVAQSADLIASLLRPRSPTRETIMYHESFKATDVRNPIHTTRRVRKPKPASVVAMDVVALAILFKEIPPYWDVHEAKGAALWYHLTGGEIASDVTFLGHYRSEHAARAAHDLDGCDCAVLEFPEPDGDGHNAWYKIDD